MVSAADVQFTRDSDANRLSLFPREGIVVSAADVLAQVSIDHEFVDNAPFAFINTISDERDEVRVA